MGVKVVTNRSCHRAPVLPHTEKDFDASPDWDGCCRLKYEVSDKLPSDCIILVVQGKENLGALLEILNGGIVWEEMIPSEEDEVQEWLELDCPEMSGVLGVLAELEE